MRVILIAVGMRIQMITLLLSLISLVTPHLLNIDLILLQKKALGSYVEHYDAKI